MMPLLDITNSQSVGPINRKRSHDEFVKQDGDERKCIAAPAAMDKFGNVLSDKNRPFSTPAEAALCSPEKPSPGLTASGSSPLGGNSPSPNVTPKSSKTETMTSISVLIPSSSTTTSKMTSSTSAEPPAKKKRAILTSEEKAAKEAAKEAERKEKEETRLKKKLEKEEAEKKKEADKIKKKLEKEEAEKKKAAEKEKKRLEKEAEKLQQAEKEKAGQKKISDMFKKGQSTPKKASSITHLANPDSDKTATSPLRNEARASQYLQHFKPFYVKDQVRLADSRCGIDDETREAKAKVVLEHFEGKREHDLVLLKNNSLDVLQLPFRRQRGCIYPSVKKLMISYQGAASLAIDLTTDTQTTQICHTREALQAVPVKSLKFREDVRPPYVGTISGLPEGAKSLRAIALHPNSKSVPSLNYDYDSEAEWQEEDGEDVEDLDDEEDEADNDEEMDDFLDDSEDVGPARMLFSGGMEPENTGLCWENRKRLSTPAKMHNFCIEFILESLAQHSEIDPFSSSYWNEPLTKAESRNPPSPAAATLSTLGIASAMAPPAAPSDAFSALAPKRKAAGAAKKQAATKQLPDEYHEKLKALLLERPNHTKVGLVEWFAGENPGCPRTQIKTSFELLTEKSDSRPGRSTAWKLRKDA